MPNQTLPSHTLVAALAVSLVTACSSMQATPMMPTYPARIGGPDGVTAAQDSACRQRAYQAAEQAKQDNVNKEIAFTAIGTIAGAAIGNAMTPRHPRGPGPHGPGGYRPRPPRGPDLTGAGAVAGASTGAAMSQGALQNTQQTYDIFYNNCIASYRGSGY